MLSYGYLITYINNEGLFLYIDLILKSKMKNELYESKKESGLFYAQQGYETLVAPLKNYWLIKFPGILR